jgi:hypothetical protein
MILQIALKAWIDIHVLTNRMANKSVVLTCKDPCI